MDCARVKELVDPYLDGELSREEATELEEHLKTCNKCAFESTQILRMKEIIGRWKGVTPSGLVKKEVLSKVHEEIAQHGTPHERHIKRTILTAIGLGLAALGAVVFVVYLSQTNFIVSDAPLPTKPQKVNTVATVTVPGTSFGKVASVLGEGIRVIGREGNINRPLQGQEIIPGETVEAGETSMLVVDVAGARLLIGGMAWRGKAPASGLSGSTRLRFASPEAALELSRGTVRIQATGSGVGDIRFRTPAATVYIPWAGHGGEQAEVSICAYEDRVAVGVTSGEAGLLITKHDGSTQNLPVKKGRILEASGNGEVQEKEL